MQWFKLTQNNGVHIAYVPGESEQQARELAAWESGEPLSCETRCEAADEEMVCPVERELGALALAEYQSTCSAA